MSTDIPTPNPAADPDVYADNLRLRRAIDDLTVERDFARTEAKSIYGTLKEIEAERDALREVARSNKRHAALLAEVLERVDQTVERLNAREGLATVHLEELRSALSAPVAPAESSAAGSAVPAEGSGQRCPSRIAHKSGVVVGCQRPVGHWGTTHGGGSPLVWWEDDDDRVITEGSGHPQPATEPQDECMRPVTDIRYWCARPVGHDGPCNPTRSTPLPILSNDTPEGDTDAR